MKIYLLNCLAPGMALTKLLCKAIPITGIISVKKEYAGQIGEYYDYEQFCIEQRISYVTVDTYSLKNETDREKLMALDMDIIITAAWQRLVPAWLIKHCKIGIIGIHGSPAGIGAGRGRSPQNWALILGKNEFSVSIFWIDSQVDSGEVIDTRVFPYELIDDINTSYHKVAICAAEMIIENLRNENILNHYGMKQEGEIGYLPKRTANDGMIDWKRGCREIYDFVRALTIPYPCAYTMIHGHIIKIIRCKYIKNESDLLAHYAYGEIVIMLDTATFWVKCSNGIIEVLEYVNVDGVEIKEGDICDACDFEEQMRMIIKRHTDETGFPVSTMLHQYMEQDGDKRDEQ